MSLSHQIANAEQAVAKAKQELAERQARVKQITQRQASLQAARATIIGERSQGIDQADHGARLALIQADLEVLEPQRVKALDAVNKIDVASAEQHLDQLRKQQQLAELEQQHSALIANANILAAKLVDTVTELAVIGRQTGRHTLGQSWVPSQPLVKLTQHGWVPR